MLANTYKTPISPASPVRRAAGSGTPARRVLGIARGESGQALVEFALVIPIVLVILLGLGWFGIALNDWIDETHLVNEAARFAAVDQPCIVANKPHVCEGEEKENYKPFLNWIRAQGDNTQVQGATIKICSPTSELNDYVEVRFEYKYKWLPLFKLKTAETPLVSSARMMIEARPMGKNAKGEPVFTPYPTSC